MKSFHRSLLRLLPGLAALFLLFACNLGEVEYDGNVFSFPNLADSLKDADHATILLEDSSGKVVDTLFHGPVSSGTSFSKLKAPRYSGGVALIVIEGSRNGTTIYKVEKLYDGTKDVVLSERPSILPGSTVKIQSQKMVLPVGDSLLVPPVRVLPENLTDKSLLWTVRNPERASMTLPYFKAMQDGSTWLVVVLASDTAKMDSVQVEIVRKEDPKSILDSVVLEPESLVVAVRGPARRFQARFVPATESPALAWSVLDAKVLESTADGWLRGLVAGRSGVVAASRTTPIRYDTAWVTVLAPLRVDSVRFSRDSTEMFMLGAAESLLVRVHPDLANPAVEFFAQDTSVAKVEDGRVRGIRDGRTMVYARSKEDPSQSDSIRIIVRPSVQVQSVTVAPRQLTLYVKGESKKMDASIVPSSLSSRFQWRSNRPEIASVDGSGTVSPGKPGEAIITVVATADSLKRDSALVVVKKDTPRLGVGKDTVIGVGQSVAFAAEVKQEYGVVTLFKWDLDGNGAYEDSATSLRPGLARTFSEPGTFPARFYVRDSEGNDTTAMRLVTVVSGPVIQFHSPDNGSYVNKTPVEVTWSVDGSRQTASVPLLEGPNTIIRSAKDAAGNSFSATLVVHLDTHAPVVRIQQPSPNLLTRQSLVPVAWTVDARPQSSRTTETLGGKQGRVAIHRDWTDSAGNRGVDSVIVFRDTIAPGAPSFVSPTSPAVVNAAHTDPVQWVWTRTGEAVDSFLVSLNGAPAVKQGGTSFVLSNPGNQTYVLEVQEVDAAGNASAAASRTVRVDKQAPPAPVVSGTTPTGSPTWSWTAANGSDGARVFRYKLSTSSSYSAEGTATSHSPSNLSSGSHTLLVQERDAAGNWSADGAHAVLVDRNGPVLTVSTPTEMGRVVNFNPQVSGTVEDVHGVRRVEYRLNSSGYVNASLSGGTWSFLGSYITGKNTIQIRSEDVFGNKDSISLTIAKYPQVIFVRKGATGTGTSWENAFGELYQALDTTRNYPTGTSIWVTQGRYAPGLTPQSDMFVKHSNVEVIGGFGHEKPAFDTTNRNLDLGATQLDGALKVGTYAQGAIGVTIDGFTLLNNPNQSLGISILPGSRDARLKNIKMANVRREDPAISISGEFFTLENCEFSENYSFGSTLISLRAEGVMRNCRLVKNGSTAGRSPIDFTTLTVDGGYFEGNYGYDDNGKESVAHFSMYGGEFLSIDKARIQGGSSAIYQGDPPQGTLIYGSNNIAF